MSFKHAVIIRKEVYTDQLKSVSTMLEQKIISTDATILLDYMKCLSVITDHSCDELELKIKRYPNGDIRIVKTTPVREEDILHNH